MADYFIDPTNGNNANAGTSVGAAWQTLAHAFAQTFAANDRIFLLSTGTFTVSAGLTIPAVTLFMYGANASGSVDGTVANVQFTGTGACFDYGAQNTWENVRFFRSALAETLFRCTVSGAPIYLRRCEIEKFTTAIGTTNVGFNSPGALIGCEIWDVTTVLSLGSNRSYPSHYGCYIHHVTTPIVNSTNNITYIGCILHNIASGKITGSNNTGPIIVGCVLDGVGIEIGDRVTSNLIGSIILNNVIFNATYGVFWNSSNPTHPATLDFNLFYNNANDFVNKPANVITGAGNIHGVDPQFVNAASNDYRPANGSPLIGAGSSGQTIGALGNAGSAIANSPLNAGRLAFGSPLPFNTQPSFGTFTLDNNNDQIEFLFQTRETGTLSRFFIRPSTIAGTAANQTYQISLQGVNLATGRADGTIKGSTNNCAGSYTPAAGHANTIQQVSAAEGYTFARGEYLAIVIKHNGTTAPATDWTAFTTNISAALTLFPHVVHIDNGAATRQSSWPVCGYGTSSKVFGWPIHANIQVAYNAASATDEYAMKFTLPQWAATKKIIGVRLLCETVASSLIRVTLFQGGGASDRTVLQQVDFDGDVVSTNASSRTLEVYFDEATLASLNFGETYRLSFAPQTNGNMRVIHLGVTDASHWDAFPGGQNFMMSTAVNEGNWTDVPTSRLLCELIFDEIAPFIEEGGTGVPDIFKPQLLRSGR